MVWGVDGFHRGHVCILVPAHHDIARQQRTDFRLGGKGGVCRYVMVLLGRA
jgi:hypothetical protein